MRNISDQSPEKSQKTIEDVYELINKYEAQLSEMLFYGLDDDELREGQSYKSLLFSKLDESELILGLDGEDLKGAFWLRPGERPFRVWNVTLWSAPSADITEYLTGLLNLCFEKLHLYKVLLQLPTTLDDGERAQDMAQLVACGFEVSGLMRAERLRGGVLTDMLLLERINPALLPVPVKETTADASSRNTNTNTSQRFGSRLIEHAKQLYLGGSKWIASILKRLFTSGRADGRYNRR